MSLLKKLKSIFKKPSAKKPSFRKTTEGKKSIKETVPSEAPQRRGAGRETSDAYKILKEPQISEKATRLSNENKYIFKIYSGANKVETAKAVANLYGVKVKDVRIINIKPKTRILKGAEGKKTGYKKAIITLEKGYKIELLPH